MGALPRPPLPPGPHRDLVETLHVLHHRAGWPSLRVLARQVGCSHTTVSTAMSSVRVPSWGVVELLVEAMGGDVEEVRALWLGATAPEPARAPADPPIAGRRAELALVRRHLVAGAGPVLLVAGEAGVGKSRLVATASARIGGGTVVAPAWCLPLSSEVPLLPAATLLRCVHGVDAGWLESALRACPPYVAEVVRRLLPELARTGPGGAAARYADGGDGADHMARLFEAMRTVLSALAAERSLAVVVEDLHWADAATLDLLEYLVVQRVGAALVMTYRSEEPTTTTATRQWVARVRRLPAVRTLELRPLTPEETADQLALLDVHDPATVERIQRRSAGLPLFTEQLAAHAEDAERLPTVLEDLLDHRLRELPEPAWLVARQLGVADRPLPARLLTSITGLPGTAVSRGLQELADRWLLGTRRGTEVAVRHPLLADAIRRRLTAVELAESHRRLAEALADEPDASPAEVAEHWQRAGAIEPELVWRIRAARQAHRRYALDQEVAQWRRALAIWPTGLPPERTLGCGLLDAYLAAYDALAGTDLAAAGELLQDAMVALPHIDGLEAAELQRRMAETQGKLGDPVGAMAVLERALAVYDAAPPCAGHVHALCLYDVLTWALDRFDDGAAACAKGVEISARLDDVALHRQMLAIRARHDVDSGDLGTALERIRAATALHAAGPDPRVDVLVALLHTDILLVTGAPADAVVAAGRPGLRAAREWGLDTTWAAILLGNVAQAHRRAGHVEEAARLIDPAVETVRPSTTAGLLVERAQLDLLRGRTAEATARIAGVLDRYLPDATERVSVVCAAVTIDLWSGRAEPAYRRAVATLGDVASIRDPSTEVGRLLVLAARAGADLGGPERSRRRRGDQLCAFLGRTAADPFATHPTVAVRPALAAAWAAEMGRLRGVSVVERWVLAAAAWDRLGRPHEAGYCRWRAAQAATATGRGALAARLLQRAAQDARGHVPLLAAVEAAARPA